MAARLTALALRFPKLTLSIILLITIAAGFGLPKLQPSAYQEDSLPIDDSELVRFKSLHKEFGSSQFIIFAIGCDAPTPCESVFEEKPLKLLKELASNAARSQDVIRVDSIATSPIIVGTSDNSLSSLHLPSVSNSEAIAVFSKAIMKDEIMVGNLISADGRTAAIAVQYSTLSTDQDRNLLAQNLLRESRRISKQFGFNLYASGNVAFTSITDEYVRKDLALLTPIMLVLLAIYSIWVFRNIFSVVLILATVGIPALWVFGVMGWVNDPITPVSSMLPILILIVGVTDAIHFLVRVFDLSNMQKDPQLVIMSVAKEVGPPTSITAITSSLGFLSLMTAKIPVVQSFGLFAALGIMGGWLLTFTMLPIAMSKKRQFKTETNLPAFELGSMVLNTIRLFSHRNATTIVIAMIILLGLSTIGIHRLLPDNDPTKLVGENDFLVVSNEFMQSRLRPSSSIEVMVKTSNNDSPFDQNLINNLIKTEKVLQSYSNGANSTSLLSIIRTAHREIVGKEATFPLENDETAQLLFLAEIADPELVHRFVTPDRKLLRISAPYDITAPSQVAQRDFKAIRHSLENIFQQREDFILTGLSSLTSHLGNLILDSQITSFSTAFITIFIVIFIFIRSFGLGLLGMIPNVFPVVMILGFMGFYGINLDIATAMIASIVLGISVDDTMYFLVHYKKARLEGKNVRDAVAFTFDVAGKPALFCAVILAIGFFVLGFSKFQSLAIFGFLSGYAVLFAAIAELVLMPAVLEVFVARREAKAEANTAISVESQDQTPVE